MIVSHIARHLADAGLGAYDPAAVLPPDATPITVASMPPTDGAAVCVTTYPGGPEPDSRNGEEYPRLQVRVRADNPLDAMAMDRAAYDALHFTSDGPNVPRHLGDDTDRWWLQDCHAIQSEAQPIGVDANGRHEFVRNYQLTCWPEPAATP